MAFAAWPNTVILHGRSDALQAKDRHLKPSTRVSLLRRRHCRPLRAQEQSDQPLYPEPEPYSPEPSAPPAEDALEEVDQPELDLKRGAQSFWRVSWTSWWIQLALSLVGAVILIFALSLPGMGVKSGASKFGLLLTAVAAILSYICLFWTFGYTRLGLKMQQQLDAIEIYGEQLDGAKVKPLSERRIYYTLRVGVLLACAGMMVGLFGLQSVTGVLLAKVLTQGFSGPYGYNRAPDQNAALGGVQPLDIFVVQSIANVMLSLFTSLLCTLWLSTRYRKRA
eukprot:Plantae.Rhodophyta-Rhodochaete_pulchella.ctg14018.p1 GENE.Plantae.Rhodophyta-Rhodochaete_pulchella.ctg14018~~Plantae.Rhodophyta-Rhodochaete_pulchella.ctg14018.p1  ORF type:complete len:320 (+),score=33.11 Plantae.Rhodophyta-Rhodochaete_pulchella.ctg14018:123-962(+)